MNIWQTKIIGKKPIKREESAIKFPIRNGILFSIMLTIGCSSQIMAQPAATSSPEGNNASRANRNVILITTDGYRWQEMFRGVDADMMTTGNAVENKQRLLSEYDAPTTEARRARLMPFFWDYVEKNGQIYGNRDKGSVARVTNKMWFSYPGYNEMIAGFADDARINSNRPIPNHNEHVFEWLAKKPGIDGSAVAVTGWDCFSAIFNTTRCGFPVDIGCREFNPSGEITPGMEMLNTVRATITWRAKGEAFDATVFPMYMEYLKSRKPRISFINLAETDSWGHEGSYEKYLQSAHRTDGYLKELWNQLQSMPEYKDNTTIIFTTDHGRGDSDQSPKAWNSHSKDIRGSDSIFVAVWGPDTPAKGEITEGEVTQAQIAATVASALGYDYNAHQPKAAPPIADAISKP